MKKTIRKRLLPLMACFMVAWPMRAYCDSCIDDPTDDPATNDPIDWTDPVPNPAENDPIDIAPDPTDFVPSDTDSDCPMPQPDPGIVEDAIAGLETVGEWILSDPAPQPDPLNTEL